MTSTKLVLFAFTVCVVFGHAQNIPVPSRATLAAEDFFAQVQSSVSMMTLLSTDQPVLLNGQAISRDHPAIRESVKLTEQEAKSLLSTVAEYRAGKTAYYAAVSPLRREALFQSIESGKVAPELAQRIQDLQDRQAMLVLGQIEKVKTALGDERFNALSAAVKKD